MLELFFLRPADMEHIKSQIANQGKTGQDRVNSFRQNNIDCFRDGSFPPKTKKVRNPFSPKKVRNQRFKLLISICMIYTLM